jgi:cytochrome c oxidase assembly protein subunit 15
MTQQTTMTPAAAMSSSASWFRRLALVGALLAFFVVVLGAWVRLTDAGLGCPDWPGCYGHVYPQADQGFAKAWHEMVHRYFAGSLVTIIAVLAGWAISKRKEPDQPLLPVIALFAIVCLQATLGALTVTLLLKPLIVTAHLVGGLSTLAILWWLALAPESRPRLGVERSLRAFALVGLIVLVMQILLGGWTSTNYAAVACPDFPTCQQSWWPKTDYRNAFVLWRGLAVDYEGGILGGTARVAIHWTHRLGAVVAGTVLLVLGITAAVRGATRRVRWAGVWLFVAVILQISLGIATVHWGVPLPVATLHNAGAAFLVLAMVTLLHSLRPTRTTSMVNLYGGEPTR